MEKKIKELKKFVSISQNINNNSNWNAYSAMKSSIPGCGFTFKEGYLCDLEDLEDKKNEDYLKNPDNLIFFYNPDGTDKYYAIGYSVENIYAKDNIFYNCRVDDRGSYILNEKGAEIPDEEEAGPEYIQLSFVVNNESFTFLLLLEELINCLESKTRIFLLKEVGRLNYTISYEVLKNGEDPTSRSTCQNRSSKMLFKLFYCTKDCGQKSDIKIDDLTNRLLTIFEDDFLSDEDDVKVVFLQIAPKDLDLFPLVYKSYLKQKNK